VAASRAHPGLLWSHNDSGPPVVFAFDSEGSAKGRVTVAGAAVEDWEDIAAGPCGQESCLYIADIGDNDTARQRITIYRVVEPAPGDQTTKRAEAFHATYPDGPRDAEGLVITSSGAIFVVTKDNPVVLYRLPTPLRADTTVQLQRVAALELPSKERITGATASPDGRWVALRSHRSLFFYRAAALLGGTPSEPLRADLSALQEPQGEGVAISPDGTVFLTGEGGGGGGTLARVRCALPGSS
jgi:hypothetical protein